MPKKKFSSSDLNASRINMPGTKRQTLPETSTVRTARGKPVAKVTMNHGGVAGGLPATKASELRKRASMYEASGATDSAKAARDRAANLEGHDRLTMMTLSQISRERSAAILKKYKTTVRRPK